MTSDAKNNIDESGREIGKCAAILSLVEVGLGSFFHAFHVPTSGHWLSLNQAFWLSRLTFVSSNSSPSSMKTAPMTASNVTACLKSLSPVGKRLTPMLAISTQGGLFNTGTLLFGRNIVGASVGAVLLSVWAFVQPVAIYYLIFGRTLIEAYAKFFQKAQEVFHFSDEQAIRFIVLIVSIKALLAVVTVLLARWLPQARVDRYRDRVLGAVKFKKIKGVQGAARGALKDLFHPLLLISLALTAIFFLGSESSYVTLIWGLLRPLAVGFILFFAIRILPMEPILARMEAFGFRRFSSALRAAKKEIAAKRRDL